MLFPNNNLLINLAYKQMLTNSHRKFQINHPMNSACLETNSNNKLFLNSMVLHSNNQQQQHASADPFRVPQPNQINGQQQPNPFGGAPQDHDHVTTDRRGASRNLIADRIILIVDSFLTNVLEVIFIILCAQLIMYEPAIFISPTYEFIVINVCSGSCSPLLL